MRHDLQTLNSGPLLCSSNTSSLLSSVDGTEEATTSDQWWPAVGGTLSPGCQPIGMLGEAMFCGPRAQMSGLGKMFPGSDHGQAFAHGSAWSGWQRANFSPRGLHSGPCSLVC